MARIVQLTSPLGKQLLFWRMAARETLGQMFEIELDVLCAKPDIRPEDLLGKAFTVSMDIDDQRQRHFNGFAVRFAPTASKGRLFSYRISLRPWVWFLTRTSDCKIFQEKSVPKVIDEVFNDEPSKAIERKLSGDYHSWVYCAQYRETDFAFVSRLMEQEGIYYYFEHEENEHKLVLCDGPGSHSPIAGDPVVPYYSSGRSNSDLNDHIMEISYTQEIQPSQVVMREYDFAKPGADLKVTRKPEHLAEHGRNKYEVFDYPGGYPTAAAGDNYAAIRIEELNAQTEVFTGSGSERDMAVGRRFKLKDHPLKDFNTEFLVTSTQILLEESKYESAEDVGFNFQMSFTAIRHKQTFRSPRMTPKPIIYGVQTAVVTGPTGEEIHCDKHGRVKVQFHWDRYGKKDENTSCFVRVAYPMAGKGWGMVAIPRIGHEVVISFEEGDPDRPLITGSVFNGDNPNPFGTPGKAMVSGVKTNTHKGKGYNEMAMDDTAGKEMIRIHGQYDMDTTVEHDQTNTVHNNFTETIKNTTKITVTNGTYSHDVAANTATYHVKGALTETYEATQATTVTKDITIKSTTGAISVTSDTQKVLVKAATEIQLEVGASTINMKSNGDISIKGVNITIDGSATVTLSSKIITSSAKGQNITEGAIVVSNGSATNTVKGGVVMLNP